ncbi:MAG: hypothetical protein WKF70_09175 [Chitinophagaceae bacterium]
MDNTKALLAALRTIEANAMETARQAAIAIRELEGAGQKKPRKKGGLTAEEINSVSL